MFKLAIILSSGSLPFSLTAFLIVKYLCKENDYLISIVAIIASVGFLTYVVLTVIAYLDCDKRDMTSDERDFWKSVLIKCFYYFAGTPVYYWTIVTQPINNKKRISYKKLDKIKGNIAYYIFRLELYVSLLLLLLSAIIAGISLFFPKIIDIPIHLFNAAFYVILPFPIITHIFYLIMLDDFVQESHDVDQLIYYFGQKKWLFGVVNYYKKRR